MPQPGVERSETPGKSGITNNSHAESVQQKKQDIKELDNPGGATAHICEK